MNLPTQDDINPTKENLDEISAVQHFLGKDLDQAHDLFVDNVLYYGEDLGWMGPRAFAFYYQAFSRYLRTTGLSEAEEAFAYFAFAVECQQAFREFPKNLIPPIAEDCDFCIEHFDRVEDDTEYTRELLIRLKQINAQLAHSE